jgi:hypothetical protein
VADDENRGAASGGWTAPEPPVVHRAFLTAYGDYTNPGAGMMALGCSCGDILFDQVDESGAVPLDELVQLARRHERPDEDPDEEW